MSEGTHAAEIRGTLPAASLLTFLIADIRGYTRFTVEHGDDAAARLARVFAQIAREVARTHGGEVIELRGDEALAVFPSARNALRAAISLQRRLTEQREVEPTLPLNAGIGLDAGEAIPVERGYRGATLNLAARLCSLAGPGEVLTSDTVANLARKIEGVAYQERGLVDLKGFAEPVHVMQVVASDEAAVSDSAEAHAGVIAQVLPIGGFLGALPSATLVGREQELIRMTGVAETVTGGAGRMILLAGEPGVGKTRLAQELTIHLREAGFLIAAGSCFETQQTVPYYPLLDVVAGLYEAAPRDLRDTVLRRWPVLASVLPHAGLTYESGGNQQEEQQRLFRAVTSLVTQMATGGPLAILLDDLHWADSSTLALLPHLARGTRAHPVLLLGTYRDVEVGRQHPLEGTLLDLGRQGLAQRISVRRLDESGTAALITTTLNETEVSTEFVRAVHESTEGNPFFTQEVLRALVERGDLYQEKGRWERRAIAKLQVPESVRAALGQRLSRLSTQTQDVLAEASVLGQRFGFDELQTMAAWSEDEVEQALDEAERVGLIREIGKDEYAFEHALTRAALYAELSPRRRRRLHRAAGEALEALPERKRSSRVAELAVHFLQADDERSLPYALRAGDAAAAVFAHDEAEAQYRTALDLSVEYADAPREAEALEKLAHVCDARARFSDAASFAERAAAAYRALEDVEGERRAMSRFANVLSSINRVDEAMERIQPLMAGIDEIDVTPGMVDLAEAEAGLHFTAFRFQDYADRQERVLALAQRLGDEQWLARATERFAHALHTIGRMEDAKARYVQALARREQQGPSRELDVLLHNLGDAAWRLGNIREALRWQERGLAVAEQTGDPSQIGFALGWVGHYHTILGDFGVARDFCERGVALLDDLGPSWNSVYPVLFLATLDEMEGKEGAEASLRHVLDMAVDNRDQQAMLEALRSLVRITLRQGNPGEAQALVHKVMEASPQQAARFWGHTATSHLAWVLLELGDEIGAERTVQESLASPVLQIAAYDRVTVLRILGLVRGYRGQHHEASAAFEESLTLARSFPAPFEEALTLFHYGSTLSRAEQREAARQRFDAAQALFQRLGAAPYERQTELALQRQL